METYIVQPDAFISLMAQIENPTIDFGQITVAQPWALAAMAAMSLAGKATIDFASNTSTRRFAIALGLLDVINGQIAQGIPEKGKTVKLHLVSNYNEIEPVAEAISKIIVSDAGVDENLEQYGDAEEVRWTLYYVIVELLRNTIQHSEDPHGAVILAQRMDKGGYYNQKPCIQIAVADCGIGIYKSLNHMRPEINSPDLALERSLWPSVSGAFPEGVKGTDQNAGMGLFFISEMAKYSGSTLLVSSNGATLKLEGSLDADVGTKIKMESYGFPGTLVAFEIPKRGVYDYEAMISTIREKAQQRTSRDNPIEWVEINSPTPQGIEIMISDSLENTEMAEQFSKTTFLPRIERGESIVFNFMHQQICTQSYMHALLFNAIKASYANKTKIYAKNCKPAIADGIRFLEAYAL